MVSTLASKSGLFQVRLTLDPPIEPMTFQESAALRHVRTLSRTDLDLTISHHLARGTNDELYRACVVEWIQRYREIPSTIIDNAWQASPSAGAL